MCDETRRAVVATAWKKLRGENSSNLYSYEICRKAKMSCGYGYVANVHCTDRYHHGIGSH